MSRATAVPVTPSVVEWAVAESGYSLDELAAATDVPADKIGSWAAGDSQPTVTQLRALAGKVRRPLATFLLPRPPRQAKPALRFRAPPGSTRRDLNPSERLRVREAARLQRVLSWMAGELHLPPPGIPRLRPTGSAEKHASEARARIQASARDRSQWRSSHAAFQAWRTGVQGSGIFVLTVPLGPDACRGFSLWDDRAPVIAVNTAWSAEARSFTLFHEYAHLLTRTNSACVEGPYRRTSSSSDPVERWCEHFAAAVLLPEDDLRLFMQARLQKAPRVTEFEAVRSIATHFKVSLRAATLRLIDLDLAEWDLYASLPPVADNKARGGGGAGRDRVQVKRDHYGAPVMEIFATALRREVVTGGDVLDYLGIPPGSLSPMVPASPSAGPDDD